MILNRILSFRIIGIFILLSHIPAFLVPGSGFTKSSFPGETPLSEVRWKIHNNFIIINYDLARSPGTESEIRLVMKLKNDTAFSFIPFSVEGDVGKGRFSGKNREIRWHFKNDLPNGFYGEEYFFEIYVKALEEPDYKLYYIVGGAAVAAVGLIALIIGGDEGGQPVADELPFPPGRP